MRVCFVLPSLRPSGGVAVALAHARGLARDHGVEAELVVTEGGGGRAEDLPVRALADAHDRRYDVAVATWWQTVPALWQLDVARRATLLQSFEQRFYDRDAPFERLSAEATLALPLAHIAVAPWLRDVLAELRPGAVCRVVAPGIDKEVFTGQPRRRGDGPLQVLIEGQPTLPFKGVREAVAAVRAMREPVRTTLVALDAEAAGEVDVDRVVGGLDAAGMAALYRESDVLVKLSRVEGLGLAPVEGFHCGAAVRRDPVHRSRGVRASRRERHRDRVRRRAGHGRLARPARTGSRAPGEAVGGRARHGRELAEPGGVDAAVS